jgi:membrane fusion protein (multidrug efflux system)
VARGSATSNELDQARTKAAASRAALDAAKARLERAVISAPIDGVLNRLPVEVGEYVSPGDVVAEIVDIDTALVVVDVPERDIRHLKVGQREEVHLQALGSTRRTGTIRYISEVADPNARTTRVEIELDNTARVLRSGQIVMVRLVRRVLPEVILIPLDAVVPLENEYRVYVVADGKAQPRAVKLGFLKGRRVQVLSGLAPGDRLITRGQYSCGPGQPVQVREEDPREARSQPATAPADANAAPAEGAP